MEFKDVLKELRQEKGLSQRELAKLTGLSYSAIGHWETGRNEPTVYVLKIFSKFFGVTTDYLLGIEN